MKPWNAEVQMSRLYITLSTFIWLASAAPAVGPKPETTFKTPAGSPAYHKDNPIKKKEKKIYISAEKSFCTNICSGTIWDC